MMPWVDMHCDLPYELAFLRRRGERDVIRRRFLDDFSRSGLVFAVISLFVDQNSVDAAFDEAIFQLQCVLEEEMESCGAFMLIRSSHDLETCLSRGVMGFILSMEGAEPLEEREELLGLFRCHGLCLLGLTWSRKNLFASGVDLNGAEEKPGGISSRGSRLVKAAVDKGIAMDVSHLNDIGIDELLSLGVPVVASHSNCRALCEHPRNLTDRQVETIGKLGGVVGFNAHGSFVGFDDPVEGMYRHISRVVDLAGEDVCALGLDLCDRFQSFYDGVRRDLFMSHSEAAMAMEALRPRLGHRIMEKLALENPIRVIRAALMGL